MESSWQNKQARARWNYLFTCTVFGFYDQWRAGGVGTPFVKHGISMEVRDNTCWSSYSLRSGMYPNSETLDGIACRIKCANDLACVSYEHESSSNICTTMG